MALTLENCSKFFKFPVFSLCSGNPVTGSRSKVTQRSDHDVAQLNPLRNIPTKFELPEANGCRDIARTRF